LLSNSAIKTLILSQEEEVLRSKQKPDTSMHSEITVDRLGLMIGDKVCAIIPLHAKRKLYVGDVLKLEVAID
jgi:hypothetical protein